MSSPSANSAKSPLDAAQKIVTELTDMTSENQLLALKFASETLGLQFPSSPPPAPPASAHTPVPTPPHAAGGVEHSTDIRSFTTMKAPKSDQQFTAVIAYFYQFEAKLGDRKEAIDAETMKEAARLAGRPQVERWNMTLTNAKNAGYLDIAGNRKYKLSSVGENLVAITLPSNSSSGQIKSSKKLKPRYKQRSVKKKR